MKAMIYALVDSTGTVYTEDEAMSYAEIGAKHGVDERTCDQYRFDLVRRELVQDRGGFASRRAARSYIEDHFGSPDKLMVHAREGRLPQHVLASLLAHRDRRAYLEACSAVERAYTDACGAGDTCLESGCSMNGDETCLQPLLRAGVEYQHACASEWVKWFASPRHRIEAWQR